MPRKLLVQTGPSQDRRQVEVQMSGVQSSRERIQTVWKVQLTKSALGWQ